MVTKMEPSSGSETITETRQTKVEGDTIPTLPVRPGDTADAPIRIKKEDVEDTKVDLSTESENIFDEVDGPEYVDLSYEGLAEVDGVEHFVCESMFPKRIHTT